MNKKRGTENIKIEGASGTNVGLQEGGKAPHKRDKGKRREEPTTTRKGESEKWRIKKRGESSQKSRKEISITSSKPGRHKKSFGVGGGSSKESQRPKEGWVTEQRSNRKMEKKEKNKG